MSKRLNIGLVLPALPGYSETFFNNKINGLLEFGYKVSLFVIEKTHKNKEFELIPIYYQVDTKNKFKLFFTFTSTLILHPFRCWKLLTLEMQSHGLLTDTLKHIIINSHIIGKQLDWIHFGFATSALGRENLALAMGIKAAVSFRGFDIGLYPYQHLGCYNLLWKKIDKVHTISDDLYQKAVQLGLDVKTPFEKITPAINTQFFKSNSFKNIHKPLRILTVGRLQWKKGYEYALKAQSILKNKEIHFDYHIVGEGNYKESICYAVHQLNLTKNVILKGQLTPDEVKQEMEWADIYIQPSIQEGFCNSVLEAQAMGLLCIVTNAEGLTENIKHNETGWVIPKRSSIAILDAVCNIISLKIDDINLIRKNAISRVENKFSLDIQREKFNKFYD